MNKAIKYLSIIFIVWVFAVITGIFIHVCNLWLLEQNKKDYKNIVLTDLEAKRKGLPEESAEGLNPDSDAIKLTYNFVANRNRVFKDYNLNAKEFARMDTLYNTKIKNPASSVRTTNTVLLYALMLLPFWIIFWIFCFILRKLKISELNKTFIQKNLFGQTDSNTKDMLLIDNELLICAIGKSEGIKRDYYASILRAKTNKSLAVLSIVLVFLTIALFFLIVLIVMKPPQL